MGDIICVEGYKDSDLFDLSFYKEKEKPLLSLKQRESLLNSHPLRRVLSHRIGLYLHPNNTGQTEL
jgi:hypothetical protein